MERPEPRVGVFVCHCGLNIAGVLDCEELAEWAEQLPGVVVSKDHEYACSDAGCRMIQEEIKEHDLNQVVVASCTPRTHEPLFRETIEKAGINPNLFELANIRDHNSWVHRTFPKEDSMDKARDTIKMAVEKVKLNNPLPPIEIPVGKTAVVMGGGVAGINAALNLGDDGFKVYLIERSPSIGGRMAALDKTFPTMDCSICILGPKMVEVDRHPNVEIISYAEVTKVEGWVGNYTVHVTKKPRYVTEDCTGCGACDEVCPVYAPREFEEGLDVRKAIYEPFPQAVPDIYTIDMDRCIKCGLCIQECIEQGPDAIDLDQEPEEITLDVDTFVVATGAGLYDPSVKNDYGYGIYDNVVTAMELERLGCAGGPTGGEVIRKSDHEEPEKIAFIQCVGSRNQVDDTETSYCCQIGCDNTIKLCFILNEHMSDVDIDVFYKDMRNQNEGLYRRVKEMGVNFIRGTPSQIVEDPETKNLKLRFEHTTLGKIMEKEYDMVVLTTGIVSSEGTWKANEALPLSVGEDGFFTPAHPKLKPVETSQDGITIAGTCVEPQSIHNSVSQARGAAATIASPMITGKIGKDNIIAVVDEEACICCGLCEKNCPYGAAIVEEKGKGGTPAEIIEAKCAGCGACAADCPSDAITIRHFTDQQIIAQIHAALENNPEDKILCFICNWCSYAGADFAGVSRIEYPPSSRHIRVMCSARVDTDFILEAFKQGANQVLVGGCHLPSDCHYMQTGNKLAKKRIDKFTKKLKKKHGIDPDRLRLVWVSATEGQKYANIIKDMNEKIPEYREVAKEGIKTG
ncbi:hypothetical protein AKJ45_00080 [candidate division MSBL1 archaeon SCGC-AAA261F19]|uniref:CoB--CoM heterodisulfide reductase iron-sulfur subunit A n=1 Tax=candidate division MSBL1 archaeon SCGC-AAA261F19 TaxID=1698275 RepID=A0A133VBR5_9EURY|nr:hypothetical protein AKJ45_00080 [candidate division MSBL1 archaeon SCGC-AAA261F19]